MRRARLVALLLLALTGAGQAGERAIVVLQDGQTIEGEVDVQDGEVEVRLGADREGGGLTLRLAPSAVARIEPLGAAREESLPQAVVTLQDGRELRGAVRLRGGEVTIEGPYGRLVVGRDEVARIERAAPPPERLAIDADLGLALTIVDGWAADSADGLGERLRLVRRDGTATLSVLLRVAPEGGEGEARVRAALASDLTPAAKVTRDDDGSWRVTDAEVDPATGRALVSTGKVELQPGRAVWFRAREDAEAEADGPLAGEVEALLRGRAWLPEGRSRDGQVWRDAGLGVLIEAPPGFRCVTTVEGARCAVRSAEGGDAGLELHVVDGPDARQNLLDLLERPKAAEVEEVGGVVRAVGEAERGVAYVVGGRTIVVVAHAGPPDTLVRLVRGVVAVDPDASARAIGEDQALLARLATARQERDDAAALATVDAVLAARPEEPDALALRAGLLSRSPGRDEARYLDALDDAWVAWGTPWLGEKLGRALLARARALDRPVKPPAAGAPSGATPPAEPDPAGAAEAIERAAQVWSDLEVATAAVALVTRAATRAFEAGEPLQAWARLARLRKLVGDAEEIDAVERGLRLRAARADLTTNDPQGARREARRAWALGAEPRQVDRIYADAEALEDRLEREAAAARGPRRSGGLVFGVPPSRTGSSGRYASGSNGQRQGVMGRARGTTVSRRGSRVRAQPLGQSTRRGARVRSDGRFVFGVPDPS